MCVCVVVWRRAGRGKFLDWKTKAMIRSGFSSNLAVIAGMPHSLRAEVILPPTHYLCREGLNLTGLQPSLSEEDDPDIMM